MHCRGCRLCIFGRRISCCLEPNALWRWRSALHIDRQVRCCGRRVRCGRLAVAQCRNGCMCTFGRRISCCLEPNALWRRHSALHIGLQVRCCGKGVRCGRLAQCRNGYMCIFGRRVLFCFETTGLRPSALQSQPSALRLSTALLRQKSVLQSQPSALQLQPRALHSQPSA